MALFSTRTKVHDDDMTLSAPSAAAPRPLVCARCGAAFECRSMAGTCWCADEDFRLPIPAAGSTEDCLCPACLRKAAD
jgi:hypothetical protein